GHGQTGPGGPRRLGGRGERDGEQQSARGVAVGTVDEGVDAGARDAGAGAGRRRVGEPAGGGPALQLPLGVRRQVLGGVAELLHGVVAGVLVVAAGAGRPQGVAAARGVLVVLGDGGRPVLHVGDLGGDVCADVVHGLAEAGVAVAVDGVEDQVGALFLQIGGHRAEVRQCEVELLGDDVVPLGLQAPFHQAGVGGGRGLVVGDDGGGPGAVLALE